MPSQASGSTSGATSAWTASPGSVLELEADIVICASGLTADLDFLDAVPGVERTPRGFIAAAPETGMTSKPGLYAAGNAPPGLP